MRTQVGRVLAAVVVVGVVASGCGGPDQAGSAVIVGTETVPLGQVQAELQSVLARPETLSWVEQQGGTTADVARDVVTRSVMHRLLQRQGTAAGIVIPDAAVDADLATRGGLTELLGTSLTDEAGLRQRVRDDLTAAELAKRVVGGLSITADLVAATSREEADTKAKILAAGGPTADALLTDPRISAKGMTYAAATNPGSASAVLFGTPVGATGYFQPNPQNASWIVFKVTDRQTAGPVDQAAVAGISQAELVAIGERMMQVVATELGIRVNPRYGVWDAVQLRVVAPENTQGTILP